MLPLPGLSTIEDYDIRSRSLVIPRPPTLTKTGERLEGTGRGLESVPYVPFLASYQRPRHDRLASADAVGVWFGLAAMVVVGNYERIYLTSAGHNRITAHVLNTNRERANELVDAILAAGRRPSG